MLAREGAVFNGDKVLCRTPLLIPSFSSKGFPELKKILAMMGEFITESVLVSAYDEHYKFLEIQKTHISFRNLSGQWGLRSPSRARSLRIVRAGLPTEEVDR